jgi:hypothetical protein
MTALERAIRHSLYKRVPRKVRLGWGIARRASRDHDALRVAFGLAIMGYGYAQERNGPRLIYKTSIDVDQGMSIRILRGRRPIAETGPLP